MSQIPQYSLHGPATHLPHCRRWAEHPTPIQSQAYRTVRTNNHGRPHPFRALGAAQGRDPSSLHRRRSTSETRHETRLHSRLPPWVRNCCCTWYAKHWMRCSESQYRSKLKTWRQRKARKSHKVAKGLTVAKSALHSTDVASPPPNINPESRDSKSPTKFDSESVFSLSIAETSSNLSVARISISLGSQAHGKKGRPILRDSPSI